MVLCGLGAGVSLGGEPVKLAMVAPVATVSVVATNLHKVPVGESKPVTNSFSATVSPQPSPMAAGLASTTAPIPLVAVAELTKKPRAEGWFGRQPGNGNFGIANLEAGYGQAYDCDSVVLRGNNGTDSEERRYFFFKKVVKF